jgi:hypothetical protein
MTKYVLNSGGLRKNPDKIKRFVTEIVKTLGSNPHILICLFSQVREVWENKLIEYTETYKQLMLGTKPTFELALPDVFVQQTKNSDAIIIQGGDDHLLQYWLKQFDIPKIWDGKVVATSSASSDALVEFFWTCDWRKCMKGLGILPIKFIPHFKSEYGSGDPRGPIDWDKAYQELKNFGDKSLPIYALEEGDYIIFGK